MNIRIALGEDHLLFRQALITILSAEPDLEMVGEGNTGVEIMALLPVANPDILLLDISLPDINGIELARKIRKRFPTVKIIALTGSADRIFIEEMIKAGARGYVVKSAGTDDLIQAIRLVAEGHEFLSKEATHAMMVRFEREEQAIPPLSVLGRREQEVLKLLAEGNRSSQIAQELGITPSTVDVHRRNIKAKLNVHTTAELTRYAIKEGLSTI